MWSEEALTPWLAALKAGEIAAAPAEGVYGYCCDPFNETALEKLVALKGRDSGKGFITLIGDLAQLPQLVEAEALASVQKAASTHWPGPVTLICPKKPGLPQLLTGAFPTIAVRLPSEPYMKEYLAAWGQPLVSTSLNRSGEEPVLSGANVPADIPALTLPQPLAGKPSMIIDVVSGARIR